MNDVLVGFVMDPFGYEADFLCAAPVVRRSGSQGFSLEVGAIDGWFPRESRKLADSDLRFVVHIPERAQKTIEVGETVWALGSLAHQALMHDEVDPGVRLPVGGWPVAGRGYRWTIGTREDFLLRSGAFANQMARVLKRQLRDQGHVKPLELQRQLYARLEGVQSKERLILLGLIAKTDLDSVRLDLLRFEYFRDAKTLLRGRWFFDRAVRKLEDELLESSRLVRRPQEENGQKSVRIAGSKPVFVQYKIVSGDGQRMDLRQVETQDLTAALRKVDSEHFGRAYRALDAADSAMEFMNDLDSKGVSGPNERI
ncbi:hypothetical protein [Microcella sp.]|uniref:hypothetical protein n=1 Tax=Microcella sp. TaxID=1913979 RepID=UPI003F6F13DF